MTSFDFDFETQKIFNKQFSQIPRTDWKKWLDISSKEEYEELAIKNSGLSSTEDIFERIKKEKKDSKELSIDPYNLLEKTDTSEELIVCHSSGTTNNDLSALKWLHMSKEVIQNYWAPGMQAIFESSGLTSTSTVVIFIPSRLQNDGLNLYNEKCFVSLYTAEFSQRLMLSLLKPNSYSFFEYKNSKNLEIITKILSLDQISAVSAPASTVLGWADINNFKNGIRNSLNLIKDIHDPLLEKFLLKINKEGIDKTAKELQDLLSQKLSEGTVVFGISSLSEDDWNKIRTFMNWEKGEEKFVNLYVASEIGPFAASITRDDYNFSRSGNLFVFPLTLPVIESNGKKELISRSRGKIGRLLISKVNNSKPFFNLDIGDIIKIENQEALPQINGKILRSSFQLNYKVNVSKEIQLPLNYRVYAGDYFEFKTFKVYDPRSILNCLKMNCNLEFDSLLLLNNKKINDSNWKIVLLSNDKEKCSKVDIYREILINCISNHEFREKIKEKSIKLQLIKENPINFLATRSDMLSKVRRGKNPKGILKKWPLYVIEG
ncbi:MAG: hypothetical protein ACFFEY_20625 [Candidatus Thorarchaeota archaeon]